MPTIQDLIKATEQRRVAAERRAADLKSRVSRWTAALAAQDITTIPPDQEARADEVIRDLRAAQDEAKAAAAQLEVLREAEREERQDRAIAAMPSVETAAGRRLRESAPKYDQVFRVGSEPQVYRAPSLPPGVPRGAADPDDGPSFLHDLYAAQVLRDPAAGGRLERHGRQYEDEHPDWGRKQRAIGSSAVSGFVPPAYLTDLFAEYARAGRPLANLCASAPLPSVGMTFQVPRVTTATAAAVQAAEGGAIGNQDPDDTLLPVPVCTIAGYVDLSRQSIERGVMVEDLVFGDLAADYNAKLDTQLMTGTGANGQHQGLFGVSGINAITYTDASPTVPELWPKLADMVGKVVSGRFTGPTAIVMSPTCWAWILAEKDTTGRPLVEPAGIVALNPIATATAPDYTRPAGQLFGVPVILDGNVPSNLGAGVDETRIMAADFRDSILFEDGTAPVQLRFEDVLSATLQIRLLAYGYSGFAGGRQPKAISLISGTGLIIPAL